MTNENTELLILILAGMALVIFGNYKRIEYNKLIATGIKTEGTIIGLKSSVDDGGVTFAPKVSYTTLENECIIKEYWIGSSPPSYKIGDNVIIFYDVIDCKTFIIDDKRTKISGPALIIIGGIIVVLCIVQYSFHIIFIQ